MMWIYEGHLGSLFASERPLTVEECYCEQCGDYDWEVGYFDSFAKFLAYYADEIDCEDGHGGWNIDYVIKELAPYFNDDVPRYKAINIVMANREEENHET